MLSCPYCSQTIHKLELGYFCEKCSFSIPYVFRGVRISDEAIEILLTKGATPWLIWNRHDSGHYFYGRLELTDKGSIRFSPQYANGVICTTCGKKVLVTPKGWECEGGEIRVGNVIACRTMHIDEVRQLFRYGSTDEIEGFVSKETGKRFKASLFLSPSGSVEFKFRHM